MALYVLASSYVDYRGQVESPTSLTFPSKREASTGLSSCGTPGQLLLWHRRPCGRHPLCAHSWLTLGHMSSFCSVHPGFPVCNLEPILTVLACTEAVKG